MLLACGPDTVRRIVLTTLTMFATPRAASIRATCLASATAEAPATGRSRTTLITRAGLAAGCRDLAAPCAPFTIRAGLAAG